MTDSSLYWQKLILNTELLPMLEFLVDTEIYKNIDLRVTLDHHKTNFCEMITTDIHFMISQFSYLTPLSYRINYFVGIQFETIEDYTLFRLKF